MKYLLFAGSTYYPGGGIGDYVGRYESIEAAKEAIKDVSEKDWGHIVDVESMTAVEYYYSGYGWGLD